MRVRAIAFAVMTIFGATAAFGQAQQGQSYTPVVAAQAKKMEGQTGTSNQAAQSGMNAANQALKEQQGTPPPTTTPTTNPPSTTQPPAQNGQHL